MKHLTHSRHKDLFLQRLREKLEANLSNEQFGIMELCQEMGVSRSQLHNKIKTATGLSTSLYIRSVRLERAKKLLCHTDLNVSEIAYEVGFRTPVYFTQVFTETMGIAPSGYRNDAQPIV